MAGRQLGGLVEARDMNVGDAFTAVYVRAKKVMIKDDERMIYHFREDGDAALFGIWGSALLDSIMADAVPGMVLRVERTEDGKAKKKGYSAPKGWRVTVEKEAPTA